MIRLIGQQADFYCSGKNPLSVKIGGLFAAYGAERPFAMFWRQTNESSAQTALVSLFDGNLTVVAEPTADFEELAAFVRVMRQGSLLCGEEVCRKLRLRPAQKVFAMMRPLSGGSDKCPAESAVDYRRLYDILQSGADGGIELPEFESWYADLSHRVRHGTARAVILARNGQPAAAAVSAFETAGAALLSGVAVLPKHRGLGLGAAAVNQICAFLAADKRVAYVLAQPPVVGFYQTAGFSPCGTMVYCR